MKRILISLISEQTIPNLKLINEFKTNVDSFIFVTTKAMEEKLKNRSDWIIKAATISKNKIKRIVVNQNSMSDIEEKLFEIDVDSSCEYIVNITGGTKLMSIAALNYFREFKNVKVFYVPIGLTTYRQIYPHIDKPEKEFNNNISLKEYLNVYGLKILSSSNRVYNYKLSKELMQKVISENSDFEKIPALINAHNNYDEAMKAYYSGKWFEEYIYMTIKENLNLKTSEIATSVNIQNPNTKNEFDVMFVYKNTIYVVECKAYHGENNIKSKIENGLYKLGALDDDFGLRANSIFITTFNLFDYNKGINNTMIKRGIDLDVMFLQLKDIVNNKFLNKIK
ncbi:MAG: DUF1887 family CARF protein [Bacteroidota bacterium]|nr:DUF1887 family CARF protein [Bacteroidota bacterium]